MISEEVDILGQNGFSVLPKRSVEAIRLLITLRYECASCMCRIRHEVATWSCKECFCIFHLYCIKKWARRAESGAGFSFRCPLCQAVNPPVFNYLCFCTKMRDPLYDPHITPHSCGQVCGKERPFCKHPCPVPCHPGPCPQCTAIVGPQPCPCGATTYSWPCGQSDPQKLCCNPCSKLLNCGKHRCEQKCHIGDCDPCSEKIEVICYCQQLTKILPCGSSGFSCETPCGKTLKCGVHKCDLLCHSGSCPPCNQDPFIISSCPCGKVPLEFERTYCTDPIPTCKNICGHVLDCQRHTCQELCHEGVCGPCSERILTKCVCGLTQSLVPCKIQDGYCCKKICKTPLSCGKHVCKTLCCSARKQTNSVAHLCRQICNKKLFCGHKCLENCHRGDCPPCVHVVSERLFCRCGAESLMPPQPCGTQPPQCNRPCTLQLPCNHPPTKHLCHYGDCPPCTFLVERMCVGGHTIVRNTPCSAEFVCCTDKCGKLLPCGHTCLRNCHTDSCIDEKHRCIEPCGKIHTICGHACKAKCHPSKSCPQCTELFERRCECGRIKESISCKRFISYLSKSFENFDLKCNADCLFERRLDVLGSRVKRTTTLLTQPQIKYSLFLWNSATKNLDWVLKVEEELEHFVTSRDLFKCMKSMPAEKRAVIHSLSQYYHISSEAVDPEPNRSCILRKTPKTCIPSLLLSAAVAEPEKNDPSKFIKEISENSVLMSNRVIIMKGKNVNVIAVSRLLQEYIGEFVCDTEEFLPDKDIKQVKVFFTDQTRQQQAYGHLRRIMPPFEFCLFYKDLKGHPLKANQSTTSATWASSLWSFKK